MKGIILGVLTFVLIQVFAYAFSQYTGIDVYRVKCSLYAVALGAWVGAYVAKDEL